LDALKTGRTGPADDTRGNLTIESEKATATAMARPRPRGNRSGIKNLRTLPTPITAAHIAVPAVESAIYNPQSGALDSAFSALINR
jgi:hypothetical protein